MVGTARGITSMVGHSRDMVDLDRNGASFRFASRFHRELSHFGVSILQKKQIAVMERFERSPFTLKTSQHLHVGVEPNLVLRAIFTHAWNLEEFITMLSKFKNALSYRSTLVQTWRHPSSLGESLVERADLARLRPLPRHCQDDENRPDSTADDGHDRPKQPLPSSLTRPRRTRSMSR